MNWPKFLTLAFPFSVERAFFPAIFQKKMKYETCETEGKEEKEKGDKARVAQRLEENIGLCQGCVSTIGANAWSAGSKCLSRVVGEGAVLHDNQLFRAILGSNNEV